jgi:ribosomal protein L7Ae-like RNA K-turn-binding protein
MAQVDVVAILESMQGLPRACKRCLAGMKEVTWAVGKLGRTKLVLLAPNIQIPSPDSALLCQVLELVNKCYEAGVPVVMGPTRKQLGMAFRTSGVHFSLHNDQ